MSLLRTSSASAQWIAAVLVVVLALPLVGCDRNKNKKGKSKPAGTGTIGASGGQFPNRLRREKTLDVSPPPHDMHIDDDGSKTIWRDVTKRTGLEFSFESGRSAGEYAIVESLGGGASSFDYDRDGLLDLMFAGGGQLQNKTVTSRSCGLFRNIDALEFVEVTELADAGAKRYYNHGIFPGDFDNDGFPDLAVSGYGGVQLLRNQGDGTFIHFALSQSTDPNSKFPTWSTSLSWGDFDGDGNLDLFVPQYVDWSWDNHPNCSIDTAGRREVCPPKEFSGLDDAVWHNDGQGGFVAQSKEIGLASGGKGLGSVVGDMDGDGDLDIYVANDTTNNFLYINDGTGHFVEKGILAGVSGDDAGVNTGSMGVVLDDADGDGRPDIWVTNFERELFALYRNDGDNLFSFVSRTSGLASLGGLYVGFGTVMLDYDFDGDRDIAVANGHVSYQPAQGSYKQTALLIENVGGGRFRRIRPGGYFEQEHTGRGVACADLDNNGVPELIFSHTEEPVSILSNTNSPARWAMVDLIGRHSNRDAIGASIEYSSGNLKYLYQRNSGGSYLSHSDARFQLFVPDDYNEIEVTVRWPSGTEQTLPFPAIGELTRWLEP